MIRAGQAGRDEIANLMRRKTEQASRDREVEEIINCAEDVRLRGPRFQGCTAGHEGYFRKHSIRARYWLPGQK